MAPTCLLEFDSSGGRRSPCACRDNSSSAGVGYSEVWISVECVEDAERVAMPVHEVPARFVDSFPDRTSLQQSFVEDSGEVSGDVVRYIAERATTPRDWRSRKNSGNDTRDTK